MLRWLRKRGPFVAGTTLATYFAGLVPVGPLAAWSTAWAEEPPEMYEAPADGWAQGEYSAETKSSLEGYLESLAGTPGTEAPPPAAGEEQGTPEAAGPQAFTQDVNTSDSAMTPQAISLPSGAATMAGMGESFTAQLTTGVAAFNVPFALPSGRVGLSPSLSLVYASSSGYGLAGVGWSLAGPMAISRQTDRGLPSYDDRDDWHPEQDRFAFGGQELVPICKVVGEECSGALSGEVMPAWSDGWQYFRARVEGAFMRFFWSPDHLTWRIQSKAGINMELGVPLDGSGYAETLERNPNKPSEIYRWHIARQYDAHGAPDAEPPAPVNLIQFRYFHDGSIAYLSDIYYTPPANEPGTSDFSTYANHIALGYELRPDLNVSYRSGWLLSQRIRLAHVDVTSKPFENAISSPREMVRRFHLQYDETTRASLLKSVAMEGRCSSPVVEDGSGAIAPTNCPRLPALSLEYQRVEGSGAPLVDSQGYEFERLATTVHQVEQSPPHSLGSTGSLSALMDVNADGLPDVIVTNPVHFGGNHGVYFNQGAPDGQVRFAPPVQMGVAGVPGVDANILKLSNKNVAPMDYDGNGTADFVHMPMVKRYSMFTPQKLGNQWNWQGREIQTASGQDVKINFAQDARRTAVMDVNGDGLVDVVFASATEYQTYFALGRYPDGDGQFGQAYWTGPETADISNEPVTTCTPWSAAAVRLGDPDVRVADLNGDGLPDIVRLRSGQIMYWPGRGNGYWGTGERDGCAAGSFAQNQHIQIQNAPHFGTVQAGSLHLADVNGDGLSDLVEVRADAVDVYLNEGGTAFTERRVLSNVPIRPNVSNPVRLTDINGSGSVDLLWGQGHEYQYIDLTDGVRPYLLTEIHNGLGKTTELEYRSSTDLMVEAAQGSQPWQSTMPLSTPLVVRATVRDNLERVGRPAGRYVTEYNYRDPVFEGRQREFRGFRTAETRSIGDVHGPTSIARSTHLLGECEAAQSGLDVCAPEDRWRDNWREPLKGLPVLTEVFDEQGVYLSTAHMSYELRQLYTGRDGRRVSVAYPKGQEAFQYDTTNFDFTSTSISIEEIDVQLEGIEQTESRSVMRRASQGTARLRSTSAHDDFGNPLSSTAFGCVEGCPQADEAITSHAVTERVPGDTSGWLFRGTEGFVTGSVHTAERHRVRREFDEHGDLKKTFATLSGTLLLDRFHESSATVAPAPPNASGGVASPVEIELATLAHDAFGNVVESRGPHGRCRTAEFDDDYLDLPVEETVFGGDIEMSGCGERAFVMQASYDRGLMSVTDVVNVTGQPKHFEHDGFGRLVSETYVDPDAPGTLTSLPAVTYEYSLPSDWKASPYSIMVVRQQDGETVEDNEYHEKIQYVDGLGRTLIALSEADASAGDGGGYVVGGRSDYTAKGAPLRAYVNHFWSGNPLTFPLNEAPALASSMQLHDAFDRPTQAFGLDGQLKLATVYHAQSMDRWDAADLSPGPHAGSFGTVRADGHGRQVEAIERVSVNGVLEERRMLSKYLPTGELLRVTQSREGSPDVVRWMRYDSQGRLVLNVEPNTAVGFDPDPTTDPSAIKAWRYAYNNAGELVGTSDPRGCGVNYHLDAAGRLIAEDYSPCLDHHAAYSAPNLTSETGVEVLHRFDVADPDTASIEDAAERTLSINTNLLWGRSVSVSDLGGKSVVSYDARGRATGTARRIVKPGAPDTVLEDRYAPRWYIKEAVLDAPGRSLQTSTGASSAELMGAGGQSVVQREYTARGLLKQTTSSYGVLLASQVVDANGLARKITLGDAAETERVVSYDDQFRARSVQTYRGDYSLWSDSEYTSPLEGEPTQQLLLEDYDFEYDSVNNITKITDWRMPHEWPESAQPVTRTFEYDDLYRLTRSTYEYAEGSDAWKSPFDAENEELATAEDEPRPSPHVNFEERIKEQRYEYDRLGNMKKTTDDAHGFFDRSLGAVTQGAATAGPHRLLSASNRSVAPSSPRKGDLDVAYDDGGNVTGIVVRRDGACLPAASSCWQRYHYEWDELGQISRARRWDLSSSGSPSERDDHGDIEDALPSRSADAELRYAYSAGGSRVLKTGIDATENERHTVYIFGSLELRQTEWEGTGTTADYVLDPSTENVMLGGGVSARLVYSEEDLPAQTSGILHLFLMLSDHLGSNTFAIDHATGELVEYSTYQAYGSTESNYRPERWSSFREPYKFTGKEEDVEVGLGYYGARYLSMGLGVWMSPDPVTVHQVGSDPNPYAYVHGRPLVAVDPDGRFAIFPIVQLVGTVAANLAVTGGPNLAAQLGSNGGDWSSVKWGSVAGAVGIGNAIGLATLGLGVWLGGAGSAPGVLSGLGSMGQPVATGAITGGIGAAGSYLGGTALGTHEFSTKGFLITVAIGAGLGAAGGTVKGAMNVRAQNIAQMKAQAQAGGAAAHQGSVAPGAQANAQGAGGASAQVMKASNSSTYFTRTRIAEEARRAFEEVRPYGYEFELGSFPANTNKCNLLVYDTAERVGVHIPTNIDASGNAWPPTAEQWASGRNLSEWQPVQEPGRGDVVAQARTYGANPNTGIPASGHVGIIDDTGGTLSVISAQEHWVTDRAIQEVFPPGNYPSPVVYLRYVGP